MDNENTEQILHPERLNDIHYLEKVAENFDPEGEDEDIDALYKYAQLLYSGNDEIQEDKERCKQSSIMHIFSPQSAHLFRVVSIR